jgi:hypothetical protein
VPAGLIDITDVVGLLPREVLAQFAQPARTNPNPIPPPHRPLVVHEPDDTPAT